MIVSDSDEISAGIPLTEIDIQPFEDLPPCESSTEWNLTSIIHHAEQLSYEHFFNNYMRKNIPCIIKNVSSDWECTKKWIKDGKINYEYMINEYGNMYAPVADCNTNSYNAHIKKDMKFCDFMNYMKTEPRRKLLYLKDWHLRRTRPQDKFYAVPSLFASDWLNEYGMDKLEDDFRFVYIGPKDSWTPLHTDVYSSFSWSVNVLGRKKWILIPPGEEKKLKGNLKVSPTLYDSGKHLDIKYYEIIQEKGDAIFVPSNWVHQVINLEDTISINHNWVNGCNIETAWHALSQVLVDVEKEIDELKDIPEFPSICQSMVKCLHGMDFELFVKWVTHIGEKRLLQLQGSSRSIYNNFAIGKNHIIFDLKCILKVVNLIEAHPAFEKHEFKVVDNFLTLKDFLRDYY